MESAYFCSRFQKEIVKRYARSADRNLGNSIALQNLCDGLRIFGVGCSHLLNARLFLGPLSKEECVSTTLLIGKLLSFAVLEGRNCLCGRQNIDLLQQDKHRQMKQ